MNLKFKTSLLSYLSNFLSNFLWVRTFVIDAICLRKIMHAKSRGTWTNLLHNKILEGKCICINARDNNNKAFSQDNAWIKQYPDALFHLNVNPETHLWGLGLEVQNALQIFPVHILVLTHHFQGRLGTWFLFVWQQFHQGSQAYSPSQSRSWDVLHLINSCNLLRKSGSNAVQCPLRSQILTRWWGFDALQHLYSKNCHKLRHVQCHSTKGFCNSFWFFPHSQAQIVVLRIIIHTDKTYLQLHTLCKLQAFCFL